MSIDDSILISQNNFHSFRHYMLTDGGTHRTYSSGGVPPLIFMPPAEHGVYKSYRIQDILHHAHMLFKHSYLSLHQLYNLLPVQKYVYTNQIYKEAELDGVGSFIAYKEGKVRCLFKDRTILVLHNSNNTHVSGSVMRTEMIRRDGRKCEFWAAIPHEAKIYYNYAQAFMDFAFGDNTENLLQEMQLVDNPPSFSDLSAGVTSTLAISRCFLKTLELTTNMYTEKATKAFANDDIQ
jgi:hypothetical protein